MTPQEKGKESIVEHIKKDHRKTEDEIAELEKRVKGGKRAEDPVFVPMKKELLGHLGAEQELLFPLLEQEMKKEIEDALKDHDEIRSYLDKLTTGGDMPEDEWARLLKEMKKEIQEHTAEEEGKILPGAQRILGEEKLIELGSKFEETEEKYS